MSDYPCTSCGACCRRVGKVVEENNLEFPYKWDETGKCEMLAEDNKCLVYENRPLICNIERLSALTELSKEQFYAMNIVACNAMMDEDNLPIKFRIE